MGVIVGMVVIPVCIVGMVVHVFVQIMRMIVFMGVLVFILWVIPLEVMVVPAQERIRCSGCLSINGLSGVKRGS